MPAAKYNIVMEQGGKFEFTVRAKTADGLVMDLSGFSGKLQIRSSAPDVIVLFEASTANGRIAIEGPTGTVAVAVGADVTAVQTWQAGVYDLEVSNGASNVFRIVEGFAYLSPEVTR